MLLLYLIAAVYILAVNLYAVLLVKTQKSRRTERGEKEKLGDGKLFITALLGGAPGIYAAMFIMKFRTDSLLLMLFIPIIIVLNIYLFYLLFKAGIPAIVL